VAVNGETVFNGEIPHVWAMAVSGGRRNALVFD
jgi:hypothetical protein